jgi:hypothetical protein
MRSWIVGFAWLGFACVAQAGDGRLEINQACVATGCIAGDAPGYPVTLPVDGSYLLTSDLVLPDASADGVVLGDRSTLDLGGFAIRGPVTCTPAYAPTTACSPSGGGDGVDAAPYSTVKNGTIRGLGQSAIVVREGVLVSDVRISDNGHYGITYSQAEPLNNDAILVRRTQILHNGSDGIGLTNGGDEARGTLIHDVEIRQNGGTGIRTGGTLVLDSNISENGYRGISVVGDDRSAVGSSSLTGNVDAQSSASVVGSLLWLGVSLCGTAACP